MRRTILLLALLVTAKAEAATRFLSPLQDAQAIGPMLLEIATDATHVDRVEFTVDGKLAGVARQAPYRIAFDFGTALVPHTVLAKVWTNGYRSSESASVTTASFTANDTLDVDIVEVPLRVKSSRPLRASDLRVLENGVVQQVRDVRLDRPAAHFAFIVDRSLSMGDGKLAATLHAIERELSSLRPGDTASLVLFNHNVAKARTITRGVHFEELVPSGGTSLRDAVASIASKERTYAIVITDGGDRNSLLTDEDALRRVSSTHTTVEALVLGNTHARFLDRAAANTGGSVRTASRETVAAELHRLLNDINSRYLVVYQSHATQRGWRNITISAKNATIVSARKGYFAE
ncbi:MAG TPA: VWA domain-containing protein [Thermoanaerobaculia bacterium]|nr:VWA domain-containing protein [Thermoanaerobaculia bacterium]